MPAQARAMQQESEQAEEKGELCVHTASQPTRALTWVLIGQEFQIRLFADGHDAYRCMMPSMSMAILACLWTLLLSVITVTGIETVVGSGRELVQALQDSNVERISVNRPIRLENEHFPAQIIKLNRNLTISSPDEGPHQV